MKTDEVGKDLIKSFEGLAKIGTDDLVHPYLDDVGVATIGYGSTYFPDGSVVSLDCDPITKKQADEIFDYCLESFEKCVDGLLTVPIHQNQFNALVSFCYNVGISGFSGSTLLKKVNGGPNNVAIAAEFGKWCHGTVDGKLVELAGLKTRRQKESDLYFKDLV